jgi:putative flippase GtrA
MIERIKRFAKAHNLELLYLLFGALTTVVSILSFAIFNFVFGDERYLISNLLSWIIAVVFAFFTNKHLVFASKANDKKTLLSEGGKFLGARVLSLSLEELILWLMLDVLGMESLLILGFIKGEIIAKTIATITVVIVNYFVSKYIVFKKK